jgi:uncharacterized protein (DUF305 family)
MTRPYKTRRRLAWQAATLMGLISGTYSTVLITLGAPRIGRSRAIDWMDIGSVLLGLDGIRAEPGIREVAAGVVVHQSADLAWAIAFFALGRRWTLDLSPKALAVVALPWAVLTSAIEYYLLLPTLQPLVPLQVPYWTALMVHVTSAAAYPLFPWIRNRVAAAPDARAAHWAKATAVVLGLIVVPLAAIEVLGGTVREPTWPFGEARSRDFDRRFMQHVVTHHEAGIQMARLALEKDIGPETATLARLIVAEQTREASLLRNWWRSWFGEMMPRLPPDESAGIRGMPSQEDLKRLRAATGEEAERDFLALMEAHHRGAVVMADEAQARATDPRLSTFAYSVRHAQSGQIRWMAGLLVTDASRLPRRPSLSPRATNQP